jgi:hypothetical protein
VDEVNLGRNNASGIRQLVLILLQVKRCTNHHNEVYIWNPTNETPDSLADKSIIFSI